MTSKLPVNKPVFFGCSYGCGDTGLYKGKANALCGLAWTAWVTAEKHLVMSVSCSNPFLLKLLA